MFAGKAKQLLAGKGKQRLSITFFECENVDSGLEKSLRITSACGIAEDDRSIGLD